jgi:MerR family transcriptional regulator/heat shock protein HspR
VSTTRPDTRPVYIISVAAELAGMHPQTLRMYERRGLVSPGRTARNIRLYSDADVERLRLIQRLSEAGMNLAGIERVIRLEAELSLARRRIAVLERALAEAGERAAREVAQARREHRYDLVRVERPGTAVVRTRRSV